LEFFVKPEAPDSRLWTVTDSFRIFLHTSFLLLPRLRVHLLVIRPCLEAGAVKDLITQPAGIIMLGIEP
jgi:hypothetical protein